MPIVKIATKTSCLGQDFKKALQTAGKIGCDGVAIDSRLEVRPEELTDTAVRHLRKLLGDLRLDVSIVTFSTKLGFTDLEFQEQRLAAAKSAMKMAYTLGASQVSTAIGVVPEETDSEEWQTLINAMIDLGNYGEHIGAKIVARTTGTSPADLKRLLNALPTGCIGIDLHPADLIRIRESPSEAVEILGQNIWHLHVCDAVRDFAAGTTDEVQLGRGTADFPHLLATLEGFGYRGWATIERHGSNVQEDMTLAVKYLRSLE